LKSDLTTISQGWSPYWIDVSHATFGVLPWGSRSQHNFAAKLCLAHNFLIWSLILQLFHRNDRHIETMSRAQHLGCFYTLNFVFDITLTLQEVYLPVSKTYSGSITRFNRLLFSLKNKWNTFFKSFSIRINVLLSLWTHITSFYIKNVFRIVVKSVYFIKVIFLGFNFFKRQLIKRSYWEVFFKFGSCIFWGLFSVAQYTVLTMKKQIDFLKEFV
jgi:hypothetical protein